jgi:hypothetical protein
MLLPIKQFNYIFIISIFFIYTSCSQRVTNVSKIEMDLSSYGVESDDYPTIHVFINLSTDSSFCQKLYYSPGHSDSTYSLSKGEIDQPTSTIKFYINNTTIITKDYGLKGDYPLQELYRIAYKF